MTIIGLIIAIWPLTAALLQSNSTPIWVPLGIILIVILLFWWGLTRNRTQDSDQANVEEHDDIGQTRTQTESVVFEEYFDEEEEIEEIEDVPEVIEPDLPIEPDDLKLIEGIGPKISSILADAGIVTFAQLAELNEQTLEKIVRDEAGIRLASPATWPEQARLAAAGKWDELEQLQEELHGGKHK
jgi:predicted flap endonuclease-1-like 5' DNA nuclease